MNGTTVAQLPVLHHFPTSQLCASFSTNDKDSSVAVKWRRVCVCVGGGGIGLPHSRTEQSLVVEDEFLKRIHNDTHVENIGDRKIKTIIKYTFFFSPHLANKLQSSLFSHADAFISFFRSVFSPLLFTLWLLNVSPGVLWLNDPSRFNLNRFPFIAIPFLYLIVRSLDALISLAGLKVKGSLRETLPRLWTPKGLCWIGGFLNTRVVRVQSVP